MRQETLECVAKQVLMKLEVYPHLKEHQFKCKNWFLNLTRSSSLALRLALTSFKCSFPLPRPPWFPLAAHFHLPSPSASLLSLSGCGCPLLLFSPLFIAIVLQLMMFKCHYSIANFKIAISSFSDILVYLMIIRTSPMNLQCACTSELRPCFYHLCICRST